MVIHVYRKTFASTTSYSITLRLGMKVLSTKLILHMIKQAKPPADHRTSSNTTSACTASCFAMKAYTGTSVDHCRSHHNLSSCIMLRRKRCPQFRSPLFVGQFMESPTLSTLHCTHSLTTYQTYPMGRMLIRCKELLIHQPKTRRVKYMDTLFYNSPFPHFPTHTHTHTHNHNHTTNQ